MEKFKNFMLWYTATREVLHDDELNFQKNGVIALWHHEDTFRSPYFSNHDWRMSFSRFSQEIFDQDDEGWQLVFVYKNGKRMDVTLSRIIECKQEWSKPRKKPKKASKKA
jgi:hypothetical protein